MNRYDNDGGPDRDYVGRRSSSVLDDPEPADREISLGTPTILGIFFALALVCAAFFGFGYTMGRKSSQSTFSPAEPNLTTTTGGVKPTAGSPAAIKAPPQIPDSAVVVPTSTTPAAPAPSSKSTSPADGMIVGDRPPAPAAVQPATSAPPPAGSFVVQVAAVSSQDVADIELAALQKKGYNVAIRHEPQDKLLHIQIGPFPDKKEAEAMRQRVIADGFNAIVK